MKKVCVLIVGQMRTNSLSGESLTTLAVLDSMRKYIFNSSFDSDVFISTDNIDLKKASDFFGDSLKNVHISKHNNTPDFFLKNIEEKTPSLEYFFNLYDTYDLDGNDSFKYQVNQFYRALCCFNMVEDYMKYDYIMIMRPDLLYYRDLSYMVDYLNKTEDCKLVGNLNYYAMGRPEIMKHYCDLSYKFGSYNKNKKNYNITTNNICSSEFFNDVDTKRWTFSPEIQLACHLYEYCLAENLVIDKTLCMVSCEVLIVRHWMIDKCDSCYVCTSGLAEKESLYKHFKQLN